MVRIGLSPRLLCLVALTYAAAPMVQARSIEVDFGPNPNSGQNFSSNTTSCGAGDSAASSCELSLTGNATSAAINLGFAIDFGLGNVSSLTVNEDGRVNFGTAFVNVYNSDLASAAANGSVFDTLAGIGEIMYSRGLADPEPDSVGNFSLAEVVPAFHVTWAGATNSAGLPIFSQLLLYSRGGGDFDLRLRYGSASADSYAGAAGLAGFSLGANQLVIAGPLAAANDYFYSFRRGSCTAGCGISSVPEPSTFALLAAALLGLLFAGRRRRRVSEL